ncbi:PilN family type IVB pilus formation outer membrane protein [Pseudomonas syringae]|uniref:PilN family type IVB pilus formation outer membrane protein n=1 Tax=Pseudomonas syringae TaxID=317 RepID=UPI001FB5180F|nr:PilN family type IVB pilus formation outer membrane protein [Pseudomonas syringae]UOF21373.1 PilN family type IVB pilus formation outer membrane protein [Pseudomonas syringae CC440]UZA78949.1 PilN family type IVB pilus formation outer membrane protein [Pseudomonas syringae]
MSMPFMRQTALSLAVLTASACSVQRVDEAAARAEATADSAGRYAAIQRNKQQQDRRDTVIFSDKPWVSTQPVVARRGLPSKYDCEVAYRPAGSVGIAEIAQYISRQCGIPVLVSPDALNPGLLNANAPAQGNNAPPISTAPNPDSLAGLLPAGITGGSNLAQASQGRSSDFASMLTPNLVSGLRFTGKASGLLDEVTARLGLTYRFNPTSRSVQVSYFDTKVFDVYAFGDVQEIKSTVRSGMTTSSGSGSGSSSGSSSGTSSSGVSGDSGSNQSTTVTLNTSILTDIQSNVRAMLSTSPPGRMYLSPSTGTLTVTDRPDVLSNVETYLAKTNHAITQQVLFNVKVFEATLTDTDQLALNWAAVYNSLSTKWGLSLSNTVPGISSSAISGSVGIVDTANSAWAGSNAIIQAIAEQARISNVRSPSVTTLNLQPAPLQIGNVQGYIPSVQTNTTASVGSSTAITPGTITSGFNMTLQPRLMDDDEMLLMVSINMSSKPTFEPFTSNGSSVQIPNYDAKSLSPKVKLRSGQTLILSGFEELSDNTDKIGTGSPGFFGLGGGRKRTSSKSVLVVLITPIVTN